MGTVPTVLSAERDEMHVRSEEGPREVGWESATKKPQKRQERAEKTEVKKVSVRFITIEWVEL